MDKDDIVLIVGVVIFLCAVVVGAIVFMYSGPLVVSPQYVPDIVLEVSFKNETHANVTFASVDPLHYGISEGALSAVLYNETWNVLDEIRGLSEPIGYGWNGCITYHDADLDRRLSPGDYFLVETEPGETHHLLIMWITSGNKVTDVSWES